MRPCASASSGREFFNHRRKTKPPLYAATPSPCSTACKPCKKSAARCACAAAAKNRSLVISENGQPALDISRMILSRFWCQSQISTKKCRAEFCDQLFLGIAFITPLFAPEFTIKAGFVLRPVGELMGKGCIISLRRAEALKSWHLHMIRPSTIKGTIATMAHICAS